MDVKREKEIAGVILFLARQVEIVFFMQFYAILFELEVTRAVA